MVDNIYIEPKIRVLLIMVRQDKKWTTAELLQLTNLSENQLYNALFRLKQKYLINIEHTPIPIRPYKKCLYSLNLKRIDNIKYLLTSRGFKLE